MSDENRKNPPKRVIHTGMYSDIARDTLDDIMAYIKQRGSRLDSRSVSHSEIVRAPDGEVVINAYDDSGSYWYNKSVFSANRSDNDIRKWLAGVVKGVVKHALGFYKEDIHKAEIKACSAWNRNNTDSVIIFTGYGDTCPTRIGVNYAYAIYEILLGRNVKANKYGDNIVEDIVGKPFDPVRVEMETYKLEELTRLRYEFEQRKKDNSRWASEQHARIYDELAKREKETKDAYEEAKRKLEAEINEALDNLQPQTEAASAA